MQLADGRTWHINPDGTGDAPTIQAGIDSAQAGDDVLLAPGTYTWASQAPTGTSMVRMKADVWLHSQFGAQATILDAEFNGRLVLCDDVGNNVRIEGLTLQQGAARDIGFGGGGLLSTGDSNPTIVSCVIRNNRAIIDTPLGGGIQCDVATIQDCEFLDNIVVHGSGGGVLCGAAVIDNCVFRGNGAGGDNASAGALDAGAATITNSVFESNVATATGGAVVGGWLVESCWFFDNSVNGGCGGGLDMRPGSTVRNCIFIGSEALGASSSDGGAIFASGGGLIENCTILGSSGDDPDDVAGIAMQGVGTIRATIIATTVQGRACSGGSSVTWICCNLFGNPMGNTICGTDGGDNFSADPQFCAVDPQASRNVTLQSDSPCAPGNHPDAAACGLIGAGPVNCGTVSANLRTWSQLKSRFR